MHLLQKPTLKLKVITPVILFNYKCEKKTLQSTERLLNFLLFYNENLNGDIIPQELVTKANFIYYHHYTAMLHFSVNGLK